MNDLKTKWKTVLTPRYSEEELKSIYNIKKDHSLGFLRAKLGWDLVVAEIIVVAFIVFLQIIDLSSSNFWSMIMAFIGIQHLFLYQLQAKLIEKRLQFADNLSQSLQTSIKLLKGLLWHYRIWPAVLSLVLYSGYYLWFRPDWSTLTLALQGWVIIVLVTSISTLLSALVVRKQIDHLSQLFQKLASSANEPS